MPRQYVAVRFNPKGRAYTYHNDGPPVRVGDFVKIGGDDGWQRLECVAVSEQDPEFSTKAILGIIEPDAPDLLDAMDDRDLEEWRVNRG
jgi:hypothetical protein